MPSQATSQEGPAAGPRAALPIGLDRKRIILLLRYVVIASAAYLVLAGEKPLPDDQLLYVAAFAASNLALSFAPRRLFEAPQFGPILLLADTAIILFGLSWGHGLSQDLLLVYFFTIFLTSVGESLGSIAVGSALISGLYGYWLWTHSTAPIQAATWVRLPFFFLIAVFYAALTEQLKAERRRRVLAEDESYHLRLLLDLAGLFSETHATREFVRGIGRFVESAAPGLSCRAVLRDQEGADPGGTAFPLRAHGQQYGELLVETAAGRSLSEREEWLCQMVAHAAAGALYSAEQSAAARSAVEMKEQFLATISHEMRTPLHAILGYSEMLESMLAPGDKAARESVERMRVNACRLQDLVEQVLAFAEVRAGSRPMRPEKVGLADLMQDLTPVMRELLAGKPVRFLCRTAPDVGTIQTDRRMLRQVLLCLLSNAAKFTDSGRVVFSARRDGDGGVEVVVADTGIGISATDLERVFEDFRQVDGSITRRHGGIGLGLTLARELTIGLGGKMEIESRLGSGTKVRLRFPEKFVSLRGEPGGEVSPVPADQFTVGRAQRA